MTLTSGGEIPMNEEKELERTIENNEWKSVPNVEEMRKQCKLAASALTSKVTAYEKEDFFLKIAPNVEL